LRLFFYQHPQVVQNRALIVYSARQASTNSSKTFVAGSPVVP
jgi:hypothetical protein